MQIRLSKLTKLPSTGVRYFDLHVEFGLTCLIESGKDLVLEFNGTIVRSWPKNECPEIWGLNWFDREKVILRLQKASASLVSASGLKQMEFGWFDQILLSDNHIFATYNEELFYSARIGALEGNALSVFSRSGAFELGLPDFLDKDQDSYNLDTVNAGYTFGNCIVFIGYPSELLWMFDMATQTCRKIPVNFSLVCVHVLSGDDKKAYAIFDNRPLLRNYPNLVPFEFAIFNLQAETAAKEDFSPIEKQLIASGFKMEALKFQPSSTGKIIVSDGEKAAFLEFSDDA